MAIDGNCYYEAQYLYRFDYIASEDVKLSFKSIVRILEYDVFVWIDQVLIRHEYRQNFLVQEFPRHEWEWEGDTNKS